MSKPNICSLHQEILEICKTARRIKAAAYEDPEALFEDMEGFFYDIENFVNEAKAAGEAMENRLRKYREAIEGLGFERKIY